MRLLSLLAIVALLATPSVAAFASGIDSIQDCKKKQAPAPAPATDAPPAAPAGAPGAV